MDKKKVMIKSNLAKDRCGNYGNKGNFKYKENTIVKHSAFGMGIVAQNDGNVVKVKFDNGQWLDFSYNTCIKERVLIEHRCINEDGNGIEKLVEISDEMAMNNIYNKKSLDINKKIIEKNSNNIKYLIRLAESYKAENQIEEAIEIFHLIIKIDSSNSYASNNIFLYDKGLYYKYKDKSFKGEYRDIGVPDFEYDDKQDELLEELREIASRMRERRDCNEIDN